MKPIYRLFLLFILLNFTVNSWAGFIPVITYSPTNPVAGQTVTFSIAENLVGVCDIATIAPDLDGNPGLLQNLTLAAGFYTTTFVYPGPGTYQIGYDLIFNEICNGSARPPQGKSRQLVYFQFGPVGGPYVDAVDNEVFISAPLIIGAPAAIPTMGQWGIIILGLLSTIFGVVMVYKKRLIPIKIKK